MQIAIVFNHPYEGSYCNAMLASVTRGLHRAGHEIDLIHLDRDGFNPVMTAADLNAFRAKAPVDPVVIAYKERLARADHLIFIFPIWWELMPALTKGFIDKVIFPGVAYDYTNRANTRMRPLWTSLKGVTVMTTMNTPGWLYWLLFGNAIKKTLVLGTFWKMGYRNLKWFSFNRVKEVPKTKRERWLWEIEDRFAALSAAPTPRPPALRGRLNSWTNWLALTTATIVFVTGLVLLWCFHVGPGAVRMRWLGLTRLEMVNLHRLPAALLLAAAVVHVALHWSKLVRRLTRVRERRFARSTLWDLILYVGFIVVGTTAVVTWAVLPGSPPLSGQVIATSLLPTRHHWIDVHHTSGLVFLVAALVHVRRYWRWFFPPRRGVPRGAARDPK